MTAAKHPNAKLNEALRANLRRRKAQQQAREASDEPGSDQGVRYSGFSSREKPEADA